MFIPSVCSSAGQWLFPTDVLSLPRCPGHASEWTLQTEMEGGKEGGGEREREGEGGREGGREGGKEYSHTRPLISGLATIVL